MEWYDLELIFILCIVKATPTWMRWHLTVTLLIDEKSDPEIILIIELDLSPLPRCDKKCHAPTKRMSKQKMTIKLLEVLFWPKLRIWQTIFWACQPFRGLSGTFSAIFRHISKKFRENSCNVHSLEVFQLWVKISYSNKSSNGENLLRICAFC